MAFMAILFYRPQDPYGCFTNFSRHEVVVFNDTWTTAEHAFQAMKFHPHRPDLVKQVRDAPTPRAAKNLGRSLKPRREDWDKPPPDPVRDFGFVPDDGIKRIVTEPLFARTKDLVMYDACSRKFLQNEDIGKTLLDTGDEPLIEDSPTDAYWGWGVDKNGQNKLGRILMLVRNDLKKWSPWSAT